MTFEFKYETLLELLLKGSKEEIITFIEDIHQADILETVRQYEGDKLLILQNLPEEVIGDIIDYAEDEEKYELLSLFPSKKQIEIAVEMSSD